MKKAFIVTPANTNLYGFNPYPWFAFAETIEEVTALFPDCIVEEDQ